MYPWLKDNSVIVRYVACIEIIYTHTLRELYKQINSKIAYYSEEQVPK